MKADKVHIMGGSLLKRVLEEYYDEDVSSPWPWGGHHILKATVTFPGDSMVRVQGKLRLYRYWHPEYNKKENAPKKATWEEHQRAWYNPARWFDGPVIYELTSGKYGYHYEESVAVDIVVPAGCVSFTPCEDTPKPKAMKTVLEDASLSEAPA